MKYILIVVVVLLILILSMVVGNLKTPDLGVTNGQFKPLSNKPHGVSSQTSDPEKFVEPFPFKSDLEKSKSDIKAACEAYGGASFILETNDYIHVVFTTGKMKYKDDVEFYFDSDNQLVHFRSESRIGYSDMGLNKERYKKLMKLYEDLKEAQ